MQTFAVVTEISKEDYFKAHPAIRVAGRVEVVAKTGEVDGRYYGTLMTCGAALEDKAQAVAREIGGFVVTVESECWPGSREILAGIPAVISALTTHSE